MVEEYFVWMTTRQIKPGTLADFERAWRPDPSRRDLRRAFAYRSADRQHVEVVGVSFWDSRESCDARRASNAEKHRRAAMGTDVVEEREPFRSRGRWRPHQRPV